MIVLRPELLLLPFAATVALAWIVPALRRRSVPPRRRLLDLGFIAYAYLLAALLYFLLRIALSPAAGHPLAADWIPFRSILAYAHAATASGAWKPFLVNVVGNVAVFVPLAFFLAPYRAGRPRSAFVWVAAASLLAEPVQALLQLLGGGGTRVVDVDDLLLNALGGIGTYALLRLLRRRRFPSAGPGEPVALPVAGLQERR